MKNIVEILKGLGLEVPEDKVAELNKQVAENYKTTAEHEKKLGKVEQERDNLQEQLTTAQETLKGFEGVDLETIQSDLNAWKQKAEKAEKDYADKLYKRDYDDALEKQLATLKFTSEAARRSVAAEAREAGLKLKDGKILGFGDLIEQIRERDASAFVDEQQEDLEKNKARFTDRAGGQNPPGGFEKMSLAEKMAYANTHPDAPAVRDWLTS